MFQSGLICVVTAALLLLDRIARTLAAAMSSLSNALGSLRFPERQIPPNRRSLSASAVLPVQPSEVLMFAGGREVRRHPERSILRGPGPFREHPSRRLDGTLDFRTALTRHWR
ncbi:MAG: hypothetical protein AAF961_14145 [Planctomycetota bacterium]